MGDKTASIDEDTGDWVTIVSKFHFVDLAGSERVRHFLHLLTILLDNFSNL
jgi:hypothetical protein